MKVKLKYIIAGMACLLIAPAAFAQDNSSGETSGLKDARERMIKLRKEFDQAEARKKNLSSNIGKLEKNRRELNRLLIEMGGQVKRSEAALSRIERRLEKLSGHERRIRAKIAERHGTIATMLSVMQRMGRQPPPIMATHRDDALKMVRSAMLLSSVIPKLNSEATKLSGDLTSLVKIVTETKTRALELRQRTVKLQAEQKRVRQLLQTKKITILAQQNELKQVREAARTFSRNAQNLSNLISNLDREVSKRAKLGEYERDLRAGRTKQIKRVNPKTGKKNVLAPTRKNPKVAALVNPGRIKPAISFARAQGLLPMPVSGQRLKSFGTANEYGSTSKGILLGTRLSAQVTSPSDGWIVFAGRYRTYGQLLIINAGGGYHIILAGMGKIDVTTGQFVLAGEPVATMGAQKARSAEQTKGFDQTLYIEFRKNGRPINPDPWWADAGQRKAQG